MQTYLVGGAVRDFLLGETTRDRDWVVVGARAEDLLAQGYLPVGRDFPVFLHPETREEYALARTERKSGRGYTGFTVCAEPSVTLEEDLSRRDLTINAMAQAEDGSLIDPFGGRADLHNGVLRHVSAAFAEDPVRILRVARFAARYDFRVADETMRLMRLMVENGEADALVAERVWQEIARGLMENTPSRMFAVLRACGALAVILPEIDALFGVPQRADYHPEIDCGVHSMMVLDYAAQADYTLPERYAALCHDLGKALTPQDILPKHHGHEGAGIAPVKALNQRLNVPRACAQLALLVTRFHGVLHGVAELRAATIVDTLQRCDAFRQPERFQSALKVGVADARGRLGFEQVAYPQQALWTQYWQACMALDIGALIATVSEQAKIPATIRAARIAAVKAVKAAA
ncbi:MAG: multifunctional CCA addition/repair protein [Neisseria sp.]|nr:multifunctional CCA addition/repair protein [Neisseria sp.]